MCKLVREGEPKTVLTGRENLNRFLRAGKPKQAFSGQEKPKQGSSGQENPKQLSMGRENLNKLMRVGGTLQINAFFRRT